MDARAKTVNEILNAANQYLVPFFQRQYSWRRKEWARLWQDIIVMLEGNHASRQHFLGPLVCTPDNPVPAEITVFQLIDGQQRLATLSMLLAAIRDVAAKYEETTLVEQVTEQYLTHKYQKGHRRFRVLPRASDREAFVRVIERKMEPEFREYGVVKARRFFRNEIEKWIEPSPVERLGELFRTVTACLSLVVITIDGENPYEIFESLNSTGLPLEESDLIRNYIFMQVPTEDQDEFHEQHWQSFEDIFGKGQQVRFSPTTFYRNYLMRNGSFSRAKATFVDFKEQNRERQLNPKDQVEELRRFASLESRIRHPEECSDAEVSDLLTQIRTLEVTTAHCLLLNLLNRWQQKELGRDDLRGCLLDLASFVLRRSICSMTTRQYNRWFPEATASINDDPRKDLQRYWIMRGWPDDETFCKALAEFPIYQREGKKAWLILERLERSHGHKEPAQKEGLTIEHVMPQRIDGPKGQSWRDTLGDDWFSQHARWLHTLGNLTLTGYNPDLSNSPFEKKQKLLAESHLVLNQHFGEVNTWGADEIASRGASLATDVCQMWPIPSDAPKLQKEVAVSESGQTRKSRAHGRRLRYWTKCAALLKDRGFPLVPVSVEDSTFMSFDMGHADIMLWGWILTRRKELHAGLEFQRRAGRQCFDILTSRRDELDAKLSFSPEWDKTWRGMIYVRRANSQVKNVDDWPAQHEWMAEHLSEFHSAFGPAIRDAIDEIQSEGA